jgi:hypothetical protein
MKHGKYLAYFQQLAASYAVTRHNTVIQNVSPHYSTKTESTFSFQVLTLGTEKQFQCNIIIMYFHYCSCSSCSVIWKVVVCSTSKALTSNCRQNPFLAPEPVNRRLNWRNIWMCKFYVHRIEVRRQETLLRVSRYQFLITTISAQSSLKMFTEHKSLNSTLCLWVETLCAWILQQSNALKEINNNSLVVWVVSCLSFKLLAIIFINCYFLYIGNRFWLIIFHCYLTECTYL